MFLAPAQTCALPAAAWQRSGHSHLQAVGFKVHLTTLPRKSKLQLSYSCCSKHMPHGSWSLPGEKIKAEAELLSSPRHVQGQE